MPVRHPAKRGQKLAPNADATITSDWTFTGTVTLPEEAVTDHVAAIDHDLLLNFEQDEHFTQAEIEITVSQISDFAGGGGGGLDNIVEDLTPQIGGPLDGLNQPFKNVAGINIRESGTGFPPQGVQAGEGLYWVNSVSDVQSPWFTDDQDVDSRIPRNAIAETITGAWQHDADITMANTIAINWLDAEAASVELATLTAGAAGDANIASVVLLTDVETNDGDGDQAIVVDVGGHTLTANDSGTSIADVSNDTAKFGTFSLFADDHAGGNTARWGTTVNSTDFDFGSGDFTMECHINFSRLSSTDIPLFSKWLYVHRAFNWTFNSTTEKFTFTWSTTGTTTKGGSANAWPVAVSIATDTWYHVACSRSGNTIRFFVDGQECAITEDMTGDTLHAGTQQFEIFSSDNNGAGDHASYIDNPRITKGVARYTTDFTPPTAAFPTGAGSTAAFILGDSAVDLYLDANEIRIRGATPATNYLAIDHDDTDVNIVGNATTDISITGITAINAGTVDADFDAITATSYGGIVEANLLDKAAAETITGENWTFAANLRFDNNVALTGEDTGASQRLLAMVTAGDEAHFGSTAIPTWIWGDTITVQGVISVSSYLQLATATDAQLDDVTHAINTAAGKIQGAMVYNTDTDNPVYAVSNADAGVWVDGAGATVNTPV